MGVGLIGQEWTPGLFRIIYGYITTWESGAVASGPGRKNRRNCFCGSRLRSWLLFNRIAECLKDKFTIKKGNIHWIFLHSIRCFLYLWAMYLSSPSDDPHPCLFQPKAPLYWLEYSKEECLQTCGLFARTLLCQEHDSRIWTPPDRLWIHTHQGLDLGMMSVFFRPNFYISSVMKWHPNFSVDSSGDMIATCTRWSRLYCLRQGLLVLMIPSNHT